MNLRQALMLACGCLLAASASAADDQRPDPKLEALMAATAHTDPDSPALLEGLLEHVYSLLQAYKGRCEGLEEAQQALDAASDRPAVGLLLPLGSARLANLSYELHRAQAACLAGPGRDAQLHLALDAAQQGVERYRDALDYPSMAVMQFNAAVTLRSLGEEDAAVAALATAIGLDHEYGLLEDAQENEQLIQHWRPGVPATPPAAALAPPRQVSLRFAWRESDAQEKIDVSVAYLSQGKAAHGTATKGVVQQVRQVRGQWHVSRDLSAAAPLDAQGFQADGVLFGLVLPMSEALLGQPDIAIGPKGDFESAAALERFSLQVLKSSRALITPLSGQPLSWVQSRELNDALAPGILWTQSEASYNLLTGAWIGATLEQGTWYQTTASLRLAGLTDDFLVHDVQFAYTRDVPCTPPAAAPVCAEIVMHGAPQAADLDDLMSELGTLTRRTRYWSSTYIRLVTDPKTLTPYCLDVRRYWHITGRPFPFSSEPASGMERVVRTFTYRAPAPGGPS